MESSGGDFGNGVEARRDISVTTLPILKIKRTGLRSVPSSVTLFVFSERHKTGLEQRK